MKFRFAMILGLSFVICATLSAQTQPLNTDVLGVHDFSSSASPLHGPNANACSYCHIPHRGSSTTPLWNQTLSNQSYAMYTSPTSQNTPAQPSLGKTSILCLSCHDGTVAVGQTIAIGTLKMTGVNTGILGTKLEGSHPFSLQLPIKDAPSLVPELAASKTTADPAKAVKLVDGNIECNTCHDVHNQHIDKKSPEFLVRDNASGQLCLACHSLQPRTVNNRQNTLAAWTSGIHSKSTAQVAAKAALGNYANIAEFACQSCHSTHNSAGPGLVRKAANPTPNIDAGSQSCFTCHDGSDNMVQPLLNVLADFQKTGHPFADANNQHSMTESAVLNHNRHTTCADCHQPHGSDATVTFTVPPAVRPSQKGTLGVGVDGATISAVTNQYEVCLRCHSTSTDKQSLPIFGYMPARALYTGDVLNVTQQFSSSALSSHPVMMDAKMQSQPSLLSAMWDLAGTTQKRPMGTRLLCTDCHNSDTNREFGGNGPNGPHGSKNLHILERRYEFSQVAAGTFPAGGPGSQVINLFKNPPTDPASGGPYSMCAKCHNLDNVLNDVSWTSHKRHVKQEGLSCSTCHSAHGVPAGSTGLPGTRLVSFDMNVVAPNNGVVSYSGGTCTLTCHMAAHNPDGSVTRVK